MRRKTMWKNATLVLTLAVLSCSSDEPATPRGGAGTAAGTGAGANAGAGGMFLNPENPGSGGTAGGSVAGASGAAGEMPGGSCAEGVANTSPVTPTVWLVLDGSGSMNEEFSGETRWQALRAALMDDGGVIATLERNVRFGMVLYSGADQDRDSDEGMEPAPVPTECVNLTVVNPALDNYATLDAQLPQEEPGGWTPTDRALEHVVNTLPVTATQGPDQNNDPVYVVLATDGAPNDRCAGDSGGRGNDFDEVTAARVLDVVGAGAMKGVKLLVISLAGGDDDLQSHLEEVSELSETGFAPFVPASRDELIQTMQELIGGAGCQLTLQGSVAIDQACTGEVTLNGNPLVCDDDNGFRLIDERTVQLEGDACTSFLSADSFVSARFPCGVFSPD
jgi:hypothetical protein